MNTNNHDEFDKLMHTLQHSQPSIADDGFTAAVMANLPAEANAKNLAFMQQKTGLTLWKKNLILLFFTLLGVILAASLIPIDSIIINDLIYALITALLNLKTFLTIGILTFIFSGSLIWDNSRFN